MQVAATVQGGPCVAARANQPSGANQRSAQNASPSPPVAILKVEPSAQEVEAEAEREARKRRVLGLEPEGWIAIFNLVLGGSTILLWRETRRLARGAEDQSERMIQSIKEAGRSASAIESVAESMKISAKQVELATKTNREIADRQKQFGEMQMRAYLTVVVGNAIYQERDKGLRFAAHPLLVNSGNTAARNVRWAISAEVMLAPLPLLHEFIRGQENIAGTIPPHQNRIMTAIVPSYVDDADVDKIKRMEGQALYVWGQITYEDVFGETHWAKYGQQIQWLPNGQILGTYLSGENDTD